MDIWTGIKHLEVGADDKTMNSKLAHTEMLQVHKPLACQSQLLLSAPLVCLCS